MTFAAQPCSRHAPRWRFRWSILGGGQVVKCFRHSLVHRPVLRTGLATAAVVGTILTAINQGNFIVAGDFRTEMAWKVPLTYCVPYCVVSFGMLRGAFVR